MSSRHHVVVLAVFVIFLVINSVRALSATKRFEYKLSFKGPHLVQRDGTIPFWEHGGHAIPSDESIRITPSLRSKKGWVWSKTKNTNEHWEAEIIFRISGRGRIGADGLAIWYTAEKGTDGPVFGSSDKWNGLGLFCDSFDNDGQHNNPYIMTMVNDGNKVYDHNSDGSTQQLGGCLRDYRNKPFPVRIKIEYYMKSLTVLVHNGMTQNKNDYELCMRSENVELPKEGYFGISAATGGLADDHDVQSFLLHSLKVPTDIPQSNQVPEDERKKFEKEFDEYYQKLQTAKDEYQKEHPDSIPKYNEGEDDKWFESQDIRELKIIYEGQSAIHTSINQLSQKLDEIVGRQERTLSSIAILSSQQGGGQPPAQGGAVPQLPYVDTIKRHEVEAVLNNQRELQNHIREIRSVMADVQSKTGGGGTGGINPSHVQDLKNNINTLHTDVKTLVSRPAGGPGGCPPSVASNCITPFYFFLLMGAQVALFFGYTIYKSNKEAAAKKFY